MTIRRSSLAVSGSSCSSSDGKSSGCRPIQSPTYRFGGSVTLAPSGTKDKSKISFRDEAVIQRCQVKNKKSPQQAAGYWGSKAADRKHAASCGECIPKASQNRAMRDAAIACASWTSLAPYVSG